MLNEEKIRLMTNMAMFEKKNGKAMNSGKNYFKSDYISRNMIRGFFSYTISCAAILCIWLIYSMDASKNIRLYTAKLKHLDKRYDYQNRSRTLAKEDRRE